MHNDSQYSKIYKCNKIGKTLSISSSLQQCEKYPRINIGIGIDKKINDNTKKFIITNIFQIQNDP